MKNLDKKISELVGLIKTRFINKDGLLSVSFPPSDRIIFDHLDDIVPFFIFLKEDDFLLYQIKLIKSRKLDLYDICGHKNCLLARNTDEYIGGLYALWKKTNDQDVKELLDQALKYLTTRLIKNDNLYGAYFPKIDAVGKYYEPWSAGLLETFCEMRHDYPKLFEQAKSIFKKWLSSKYFKIYKLFPYRHLLNPLSRIWQKNLAAYGRMKIANRPPIMEGILLKDLEKNLKLSLKNSYYSQMMKSNSTPAFTMLEFYLATEDKYWLNCLRDWINSALNKFCRDGEVFHLYSPKKNRVATAGLAPAFILCDLICDYSYFTGDKSFLPETKKIIDCQLERRLENDLLPEFTDAEHAHLDNQIDFAISMRRYAELSGKEKYLKNSVELTEKAIEKHYSPDGYLTYWGESKEKVISSKYNSLLLKGFINLKTKEEKIYPKYHFLFKDR